MKVVRPPLPDLAAVDAFGQRPDCLGGFFRGFDTAILFDTEYTTWDGAQARLWSNPGEEREIVEIGAVCVATTDFTVRARFRVLIRPVLNPILSRYFMDLTGITQHDLDREGVSFETGVAAFSAFAGAEQPLCSNGSDGWVIAKNSQLLRRPQMIAERRFADLRAGLMRAIQTKDGFAMTTGTLPELLGLAPTGRVHSALDDAMALARTLAALRRRGRV